MNLDTCTPGQRASVEHVSGPLLVSAGAGSGKTFTLTQRIAYALLPESGPAARGVDEVLAITFTEKAAAEIKARVKRTLRAENMAEEALKVDAAWISTIHGMCARILRTHALELGLDPAFGIVGDSERADLVAASIDEALGRGNNIIARGSYAALFDEYPARSVLPSAPSVASMLEALMDKAVGLRGGLDAVDFGPEPAKASLLARELLLAYEDVLPVLERAGNSTSAQKAQTQAADAVEALVAFLDGSSVGEAAGESMNSVSAPASAIVASTTNGANTLGALASVVDTCAYLPGNFGSAEVKAEVKAHQAVYTGVCRRITLGLAYPRAAELLALARDVYARYEDKKRAACKLDNDDLLVKTLEAFEAHPDIARRYEDRFKLVMVDEFQDTSQLQIDMIARLAGCNFAHLCTVGDAQQSIYRFRGADVNVYEAHKRVMRSDEVGALYVELAKNFRSHADVLSFVDRIFEQPQVFGDHFMSLAPNETRPSTYKGDGPRVDLVLALQPAGRGTGVSTDDAKRTCARAIAQRFAALRACGHAPRDMVVLLGKMGRAETYAEALRDEGFECAVTGGSLFASAPEVRVVARFVEVLANPANTAALFEVLTSDMMRLSADDLLELATGEDLETGVLRRRDLDRGFASLAKQEDLLSPRLAHAVRILTHAWQDARTKPASCVVQDAVVRSGWMARLQEKGAAGMACAANVLKAIRLIEQLENERHTGLASTSRAFTEELAAGMKEAPGALSGSDGDVVKIMTIHASKGLEFPIVALADFAGASRSAGKLVVETCGGTARASLAPGASLEKYPQLARRSSGQVSEEMGDDSDRAAARCLIMEGGRAHDASGKPLCMQDAYRAALCERVASEDLAEARRKLYVGLTRASEALVVAMDAKATSAGKEPSYPTLVDDVRSALCGTADFPEGVAMLEYGGSQPAHFERVLVLAEPDIPEGEDASLPSSCTVGLSSTSQTATFLVPRMHDAAPVPFTPWSGLRADVFSYTSIAVDHGDDEREACTTASESSVDCLDRVENSDVAPSLGNASCATIDEVSPLQVLSDGDKATSLGSAFHRAAQFAIETLQVPDQLRLDTFAKTFSLSATQKVRFDTACARWFASATYAEVREWSLCRAEVPFFVSVGNELMEGEIDLLCTNGIDLQGDMALVVDYKTGGADDEDVAALQAKHALQAECYAYALLSQGIIEVELRFVRVERVALGASEPQTVCYHFNASDREMLFERIVAARAVSLA